MSFKAISDNDARLLKAKQVEQWNASETNKYPTTYHVPSKVKFPLEVALIASCYAGDQKEFERLLKLGVDINTQNQDGLTCVHLCCISGDKDFLEFLVKHGADLNIQDNEGWSPLHAAASVGFENIVRFLIENGANLALLSCEMELAVDVSSSNKVTNLLNASMQEQGIDPEKARDFEQHVMLQDARQWLESGEYRPVIDPLTGASPLHVAACKDYTDVLQLLLRIPDLDVDARDSDGWTPLHAAAHWNRESGARLLAQAGASFDTCTYTNQSLFDVADREMMPILRQLRDRQRAERPKSRPNVPPKPVSEAVKRGHPDTVEPSTNGSARDDELLTKAGEGGRHLVPALKKKPIADASGDDSASLDNQSPPLADVVINGRQDDTYPTREEPSLTVAKHLETRSESPPPSSASSTSSSSESFKKETPSTRLNEKSAVKSSPPRTSSESQLKLRDRQTNKSSPPLSSSQPNLPASSAAAAANQQQLADRINLSYSKPRARRSADPNVKGEGVSSSDTSVTSSSSKPYKVTISRRDTPSPRSRTRPRDKDSAEQATSTSSLTSQAYTANIGTASMEPLPTPNETSRRGSVILAPSKSGKTETERTVRARQVRLTRRSTQGVSTDEVRQALAMKGQSNNNNKAVNESSPPLKSADPVLETSVSSKSYSTSERLETNAVSRGDLPIRQIKPPPRPPNLRAARLNVDDDAVADDKSFAPAEAIAGVIPRPSSRSLRAIDSTLNQANTAGKDSGTKTSSQFMRLHISPTKSVESASACNLENSQTDFRQLYDRERANRERLERELDQVKRDNSSLNNRVRWLEAALNSSATVPARKSDRSSTGSYRDGGGPINLSTLPSSEDQAKEIARLQEENVKIKDDNSALIRVISKLSRGN